MFKFSFVNKVMCLHVFFTLNVKLNKESNKSPSEFNIVNVWLP